MCLQIWSSLPKISNRNSKNMKSYLLLAFTFTVVQAVTHGLTNTPLSHVRRSDIGQRIPRYSSQRFGYSGRPQFSESLHQETGNFYGGQRNGRFYSRDGRDNVRGLQYSVSPGSEWSNSRGQISGPYSQQYRAEDGFSRDGFGYGAGRGQISFNAPLANTRSYSPQYDSYRNF